MSFFVCLIITLAIITVFSMCLVGYCFKKASDIIVKEEQMSRQEEEKRIKYIPVDIDDSTTFKASTSPAIIRSKVDE